MKKARLFRFILIITIMLIHTAAAGEFAFNAQIQNNGEKKYKALRLTPEVYNGSARNLADIRIFNNGSEPVPYFINSYTQNTAAQNEKYEMRLINSYVKDEYFYFDYKLTDTLEHDVLATSISLLTQKTGFAKEVQVFGGYDNIHWELIKSDTIYDVDGNKKLEIMLGTPQKYTHYRFRLSNNLEKLSFDSAWLIYSDTVKTKEYFTETLSPAFQTETLDKETHILISGLKNVKIESVSLTTDSMFKRTARFAGGKEKTIYNLSLGETLYQDLVLPFDGFAGSKDTVEIIIDNKDDKPITIGNVSVTYYTDEIVFDGSGSGHYTLCFGSVATPAPPPVYDIANYKDLVLQEGYDAVTLGTVYSGPAPQDTAEFDFKPILNIVVTIVAIMLGALILLKLKKKQ